MTESKTRTTVAGEANVIQKVASDRTKAEKRIHKIEREPRVSSESHSLLRVTRKATIAMSRGSAKPCSGH